MTNDPAVVAAKRAYDFVRATFSPSCGIDLDALETIIRKAHKSLHEELAAAKAENERLRKENKLMNKELNKYDF